MSKRLFSLTPVTGVHIGTGEELTFLDYKLARKIGDLDLGELGYWKFSNDRILQRLVNDEKAMAAFENASVKGNIKELQKFFQENCVNLKDTDYPCKITKGFLKTYNENLNKDPHQNAAKVLQMYHTEGTPYPVIPGSSLKGSIRTALLNKSLENQPEKTYQLMHDEFKKESNLNIFEQRMQKKLFEYSDAKNDPLRAVAISDCSFKATDTQLVGGLNLVSNKQSECLDKIGAPIQAEVLRGELLNGKAVSELSISINDKLQGTARIKSITFEDIYKSCNDFYRSEFHDEYDKFYKNVNDGTEKLLVELKNKLEKTANTKGQFIIRVGRWSQVEFVTFEDNFRKPLTKKDKFGKPLGYGDTRTLFDYDGLYVPMGWCILAEKG